MKEELTIRVAKPEDAKGLLEIYAPYVERKQQSHSNMEYRRRKSLPDGSVIF